MKFRPHRTYRVLAGLLAVLVMAPGPCGAAADGDPIPTVRWAATFSPATIGHGGDATVEVSAQIQEGWHVYAPGQAPGGPTPLRVTLDNDHIATLAGPVSCTTPQKKHDPSFDLDTLFFVHSLHLHVPVHLVDSTPGARVIPVSVRFQICSERECQPPATVHLDVPVDARS